MRRQKSNLQPSATDMQTNSIIGKYTVDPADVTKWIGPIMEN